MIHEIDSEVVIPKSELSLLDRTTSKNSLIYNFETCSATRDFQPWKHCLRLERQVSDLQDCFPYALTFTFNAENMKERSPFSQWELFKEVFDKWKSLFLKRMGALCNERYIISYEIYPELTKSGIIHAHALLYYNSNYQNIRTIMSKCWVDKAKSFGVKMSAMKKKTIHGYDYAFDRCNNVDSWRKYITKEHVRYADKPALQINTKEITLEFNV